jgi:hypothetical protein
MDGRGGVGAVALGLLGPEIAVAAGVVGTVVAAYIAAKAVTSGIESFNEWVQQAQSSGEPVNETLPSGQTVAIQPTGAYVLSSSDAVYYFNGQGQMTNVLIQGDASNSLFGTNITIDNSTGAISATDGLGSTVNVQVASDGNGGLTFIDPATGQTAGRIVQTADGGYTVTNASGAVAVTPLADSGDEPTVTVPLGDGYEETTTTTANGSTTEVTGPGDSVVSTATTTSATDSGGNTFYQTSTTADNGDTSEETTTVNANGSSNSATTDYDAAGAEIGSNTTATVVNSDGSTTSTTDNYSASGALVGAAVQTETENASGVNDVQTDNYDASGNLASQVTTSTEPGGQTVTTETDSNGDHSTSTDNSSQTQTITYNADGQPLTDSIHGDAGSSDPDYSTRTVYSYNANGVATGYTTSAYNLDGTVGQQTVVNSDGSRSSESFSYTNGVLNQTTTTYYNTDGSLNRSVTDSYNPDGTTGQETVQNGDGTSRTTSNTYTNGVLTQSSTNYYNADGSFSETVGDHYNSNGSVSEQQVTNSDGSSSIANYTYTNNALISTSTNYYNSDASPNGSNLTFFNSNASISETVVSNPDGTSTTSIYSYNSDGSVRETDVQNSDGSSSVTQYIYNPDGSVQSASTTGTNANGSSYSITDNGIQTETISYNAAGQEVSDVVQADPGVSGPDTSTTYSYNSDGTLSQVATQSSDGSYSYSNYDDGAPDGGSSYDAATGALTQTFELPGNGTGPNDTASASDTSYPDGGISDVGYNSEGQPLYGYSHGPSDEPGYGYETRTGNTYDDNDNLVKGYTSTQTYTGNGFVYTTTTDIPGVGTYTELTSDTDGVDQDVLTAPDGDTTTTDDYFDDDGILDEVTTTYQSPDGAVTGGSTTEYDVDTANNTLSAVQSSLTAPDENNNNPAQYSLNINFDNSADAIQTEILDQEDWNYQNPDFSGYNDGTEGGGYALTGNSSVSGGHNIGIIAQFDVNNGNGVAAIAAEAAADEADAALLATGVSSGGISLEGPIWSGKVITWSLATSAGPANAPFSGYIGSQYLATIESAFAAWSAATGITFEQVSDSSQSNIRLGWGDFQTSTSGVLAYTSYHSVAGQMTNATIQLENPTQDALTENASGALGYSGTQATLSQVLLHEIGHALGLGDSSDATSIMYSELNGSNQTLNTSDAAEAAALYSGELQRSASTVDYVNPEGQLVSQDVVNANGSGSASSYDSQGRPLTVETVNANGSTDDATYAYNADGSYSETVVSTPAGGGTSSTTISYYDASGNPLSGPGGGGTVSLQGTGSDQTVTGLSVGPDVIVGGYAGDLLVGLSGHDTFVYNSGSGAETLQENSSTTSGSANVLQFGAGIAPSMIALSLTATGALTLSIGSNGDSVTILGFEPTDPLASMPIQQFEFGAGAGLSFTQLLSLVQSSSAVGTIPNAGGGTTHYEVNAAGDPLYNAWITNTAGQTPRAFTINANGSTEVDSYVYGTAGNEETHTAVATAVGASASTTSVTKYDNQGRIAAAVAMGSYYNAGGAKGLTRSTVGCD